MDSLRSRRLEEVGETENRRARGRHARGDCSLSPRVSPSRAAVSSCAHYFQAPATQAIEWMGYCLHHPNMVSAGWLSRVSRGANEKRRNILND